MRTRGVVEGDIFAEQSTQMPFVQHDHVVEALATQGADDPLGDRNSLEARGTV